MLKWSKAILCFTLSVALLFPFTTLSSGTTANRSSASESLSELVIDTRSKAISHVKEAMKLPEDAIINNVVKLHKPTMHWEVQYVTSDLNQAGQPRHTGTISFLPSGALMQFYIRHTISDYPCSSPCNEEISYDEALKLAQQFVRNQYWSQDSEWMSAYDNAPFTIIDAPHDIRLHRAHNGIRFPDDYVDITINNQTGEVAQYTVYWSNVELPPIPEDMLSIEEASSIMFEAIDIHRDHLTPDFYSDVYPDRILYYSDGDYTIDMEGNFYPTQSRRYSQQEEYAGSKYPKDLAKLRILSLYNLELQYKKKEWNQTELIYRAFLKHDAKTDYWKHPYVGAESGAWINAYNEIHQFPALLEPGSWFVPSAIPSEQLGYSAAIVWDQELLIMDNDPVIQNGTTLVPVRELLSRLDVRLQWDAEQRKVTASKDGTIVELKIDEEIAAINGENRSLGAPARIINKHTYIPARIVLETFGAKVAWHAESRFVIVQSDKENELPRLSEDKLLQYRYWAYLHAEEKKLGFPPTKMNSVPLPW
ncbi:copper amine oxidase N-terminal domain-containing protein [Paenibacillus sp. J5C_2022]|uniref:copper amine oxidase N-terminal domain-containing protein n=1 Tax=Paenibacillus sp. J5C2022 TaxID=2977129 RepID=UPI0021D09B60|nr:copper amine oxidase N-terminal domain-containing protein [Paenibacillus sp. J5C2022]MCU6707780.1 copper amine oxidase N-terminal domain-containing protein [Paenibacillus sp. J5C2022]